MIELALKARLPIVSVMTDDLMNYEAVLNVLSGRKVVTLPTASASWAAHGDVLFVTTDQDKITTDLYRKMVHDEKQVVLVNPTKQSPLVFDAGVLPTPPVLATKVLEAHAEPQAVAQLLPICSGLSIMRMSELIALTEARTGGLLPAEVRKTRSMISPSIQGLIPMDATFDLYVPIPELEKWLDLNAEYFTKSTHARLVPRGLLLEGLPGTGKSMAAKVVAQRFKVPLYRMDMASVLDKYVGVSESRVARILSLVDRESPCVLLIDEVEKLFSGSGEDSGVTSRILSQLLWWLQEHQSKVFTIMTTNNSEGIPPELYRSGRLDARMRLEGMATKSEALDFMWAVIKSMMPGKKAPEPIDEMKAKLLEALPDKLVPMLTHADATSLTMEVIKRNKWL